MKGKKKKSTSRKKRSARLPKSLKNPLVKPLVSIVMTAYNESHVIGEAIETLLQQSYKKIELILVDDASKDNTTAVMRGYTRGPKKDRRVKVIALKKNSGPGGGRNAGAKKARGEILVFIDADMVFDKHYIRDLIKPIVDGKVIGTFHSNEMVKNPENLWARTWCINRVENIGKTSGVFRAILKSEFDACGGFDTSRGYFDDALPVGEGQCSYRTAATCYHKNPERLSEAFRHSRWVGRSLIRDKHQRRRAAPLIVGSWLALLTGIILSVLWRQPFPLWPLVSLMVLGLLLITLFAYVRGLRRVFAEKRPEYLFSMPILWTVRFAGYYVGACGQLLKGAKRKGR